MRKRACAEQGEPVNIEDVSNIDELAAGLAGDLPKILRSMGHPVAVVRSDTGKRDPLLGHITDAAWHNPSARSVSEWFRGLSAMQGDLVCTVAALYVTGDESNTGAGAAMIYLALCIKTMESGQPEWAGTDDELLDLMNVVAGLLSMMSCERHGLVEIIGEVTTTSGVNFKPVAPN